MDHHSSELHDSNIKTRIENEFEASERHHLLNKARDQQFDDRLGSHKKWRHREFLRHREEMETQLRERITSKRNAAIETEKERQRMEELRQATLKRQQEIKRRQDKRKAEADMLGLESEHEVTILRQRLAAAAYTDGGVSWEKLFHHFDRDNSNALTFDEFSKSIRREAKISDEVEDIEENIISSTNDGSTTVSSTLLQIDDASLRKLFDAVDSSGQAKSTVIFFSSDNG